MLKNSLLVISAFLALSSFSQTLSELKAAVKAGVKNAELSIYTSDKPKESGVLFCVEVHTTFSDGSTVVINEGGSFTKYEGLYEYEVNGARSAFSSSESPIFYFDYCDGSKQSSIHVKVRPANGGDWIIDEQVSYRCFVDPSIEEERLAELRSKQEEEERKKEEIQKEQDFQNTVASFSDAEKEYASELVKRGYVEDLRAGQKEIIQIRKRKVVMESVQYWQRDPAVTIEVGNKDNIYVPRSADTLHYFNASHKNLGVIFDGDRLVRLTSYTNDEEADENGSVLSYGSQLFEHKQSTAYASVAGEHNAHTLDYRTKANLVQYRKLESGGFIVVTLDLITIYNDDLTIAHEITSTSRIEGNKFLDAIRIPDSEDFAVLYTNLSGKPRVSRYFARSRSLSKNWIDVTCDYLHDQVGTGIKYPFTNRIFKADENSFAVFLNMRGASISEVSKFKFNDLEASSARPIWCKTWHSRYFLSMSRLPNGKIMVLNTGEGHNSFHDVGNVQRNDLDITVESTDELMRNLVSYDESVEGLNVKYFYPQKDGSLIVLKRESYKSDYSSQFLLHHYNADFEFVASYKLPLPFHVELAVFFHGINSNMYIYKQKHKDFDFVTGQLRSRLAGRNYNPENNKYTYSLKDGEVCACSGVSFEVFEEAGLAVSAKDYFWNLQSLDFSLDNEGKYMYMITPTTLQKVDLKDVVLAKPFSLRGDEYDE